jgi:polysaccharide export outer membrane protein
MKRILIGLVLMAAALPGLGQTGDKQGDKLGVGDAVRVTVFQQPDLTSDTRVNERGSIAMPLLGDVKVTGMTPSEAAGAIAGELKKKQFLKNPQVTVALTTLRSRQVSVLGLVARPGRYPLEDSNRIGDMIAAAGGVQAGGADTVTIIRNGEAQKVEMMAKGFNLQNGDTVYVDRAPVFYIYGEVTRAGAYRLEQNMTVMQAIAAGGGITPRGSERRLKMRRPGSDGKVVENDARLQDTVQADDVIFVKESLF